MKRSSSQSTTSSGSDKPADYVRFERSAAGFSDDALHRAKAAQLKLEHFYKVAVDAAIERNTRCVERYRLTCQEVLMGS
jgi:protein-serine/threonine kinase